MLKEIRVELIVTGWYKDHLVKIQTALAVLSRFLKKKKKMKTSCYKVTVQTLYCIPGEEKPG